MKLLVQLDAFLLYGIFQRISNKFETMTGKNCYFLAKQFYLLGATISALMAVTYRNHPLAIMSVLGAGVMVFLAWTCEWLEKQRPSPVAIVNLWQILKRITALACYIVLIIIAIKDSYFFLLGSVLAISCGNYWTECVPLAHRPMVKKSD